MLEKLGSPHFRQFHDMLLLSIIEYIESDIRPWQSMWYQVSQESHSRAFDFQVTALPHDIGVNLYGFPVSLTDF